MKATKCLVATCGSLAMVSRVASSAFVVTAGRISNPLLASLISTGLPRRRICKIEFRKTAAPAASGDVADDSHSSAQSKLSQKVWFVEDLECEAEQEGVGLSISTVGPGFRIVARSTRNSSDILGYCEGFVRPAGHILHLDKMEVFKTMVQRVKAKNPDFRGGGTTFGVGLLFGYRALLHGMEQGCVIAEFLAIDDEEFQHRRLVRYYSRAGFTVVRYVGDGVQDIPARLVWGGRGTLMRANIEDLLPLWTRILEKSTKMQG